MSRIHNKAIAASLIFTTFAACAISPAGPEGGGAKILVRGLSKYQTQVLIRSVDGGEILFVRDYELGTEVRVTPGPHEIRVMCLRTTSFGSEIFPGKIELTAKRAYSYFLFPAKSERNQRKCEIRVQAKDAV